MEPSGFEKLAAFEKIADAQVAALPIGVLPIHVFLAHYHISIFHLCNIIGPTDPSAFRTGDNQSHRLSYLLDWLRTRPQVPVDRSAGTARLKLINFEEALRQISDLSLYSIFSEVMPDVHRGRYTVKALKGGFRLKHRTVQDEREDAYDTIMSELAANDVTPFTTKPDPKIDALAAAGSPFDERCLLNLYQNRSANFMTRIREDVLVGDLEMVEVVGVNITRFREIQSALLGYALVRAELARKMWLNSGGINGEPSNDAMDLVSTSTDWSSFIDVIAAIAGGSRDEIERVVEEFTFEPTASWAKRRGGEGFMPPIVRLGTEAIVSPDLLMRFLQPRNVLYHIMRTNEKKFNKLVSQALEPTLASSIEDAMSKVSGCLILRSVKYDGGEIDIMVVDPKTGTVLICEIKGVLPPHGSRLIARTAGRIREGLDQLQRFRNLSEDTRKAICEKAAGVGLNSPTYQYMIMARSCFGETSVWRDGSSTFPANLPLIRLATARLATRGGNLALELPAETRAIAHEIVKDVHYHWTPGKMRIFGKDLYIPQCRYDNDKVAAWRDKAKS